MVCGSRAKTGVYAVGKPYVSQGAFDGVVACLESQWRAALRICADDALVPHWDWRQHPCNSSSRLGATLSYTPTVLRRHRNSRVATLAMAAKMALDGSGTTSASNTYRCGR